jgi:hypothetical protein
MIASVRIVFEIRFQKIGKEKDFQDDKHYKEFDEDYQPNLFPPLGHICKTISVKAENFLKQFHYFG